MNLGTFLFRFGDYHAFGMQMPDRKVSSDRYRYGFNSHEGERELNNGYVSWGDYGYDSRIGRRYNIDPRWGKLPGQSPYSSNNDNPISYTDPSGEFGFVGALIGAALEMTVQATVNAAMGKPILDIDWGDVVVAGAVGAVTGGLGNVARMGRIGSRILKAANIEGKVAKMSINAGINITSEGIKAGIDIKVESDNGDVVENNLRMKWVFGSGKNNKKDGTEALVEFAAGSVLSITKGGIKKVFKDQVNKTLTEQESKFVKAMAKKAQEGNKIAGKAAESVKYKTKIGIDFNNKGAEHGGEIILGPLEGGAKEGIKDMLIQKDDESGEETVVPSVDKYVD